MNKGHYACADTEGGGGGGRKSQVIYGFLYLLGTFCEIISISLELF